MNVNRYGNPDAGIVLIQMVDDHDLEGIENEVAEIRRLISKDFCLITIKVSNWNTDLSPWEAPAVFGKENFGDGAGRTLTEVLKYTQDHGAMQPSIHQYRHLCMEKRETHVVLVRFLCPGG